MDKKELEILQGEGKFGHIDELLKVGGAVVGFAKKSIIFGFQFTAEVGDSIMYSNGQDHYARNLRAREPKDRAARDLKTARKAFKREGHKAEELAEFATLSFASANHELQKIDPKTAIENAPAVTELVKQIPDTEQGAAIAEKTIAEGLAPIVDDYNLKVRPIGPSIPPSRKPE